MKLLKSIINSSLTVPAFFYAAVALAEVPQFGTASDPVYTKIASSAQGLQKPSGLAFNPDFPEQLWVVNYASNGVVIVKNPGLSTQKAESRIDSHAGHFMPQVTSLAFGERGYQNSMTFATCQDSRNGGNDFMGPTLWSADLNIFARVNQQGPLLGSHLDMLHQSPLCMGIAFEDNNVFWVADGKNGHIVRYDFAHDHGPGHDNHSDGVVRRYTDASFTRVSSVPGHMALDKATGWLYVADTGAGRVYRLNTLTGERFRKLSAQNEPLAEFSEWRGATREIVAGNLKKPSSVAISDNHLFIGLYGSGEIIAYELASLSEAGRISTGSKGIADLTIGPDGKLWFTDMVASTVTRIDPK